MASEDERHRLGVLERGSLEEIAKPPSSRSRTGSRVTSSHLSNASASSTSSRLRPQVAAALELLTPEEVMEQEFDLELEDYGGSSDDTTEEEGDTGRTSEIFRIAEPLRQPPEVFMSQDSTLTEDDDDKQLAIYGSLLGDEETVVDSDEENLIMKEIRAEITAQVRSEMKSELEMYRQKREALTSAIDGDKAKEEEEEPDEEDPKLKEAIIKMRKLDRILSRKVQREKQVKRDRILLQRRLADELANIKRDDGSREPKEVQTNTAKFLALTLPPSHNIGVTVEQQDSSIPTPQPPVTPLFATQYVDEGSMSNRDSSRSGKSNQGNDDRSEGASTSRSKQSQDGTASQSGNTEDSQSTYSGVTNSTNLTGKSKNSKKKNFLKRNKELASDAANVIAMTEDEKRRVDNLLINLEALPEVPEEEDSVAGDSSYNPFQVVLADGEGFMPESGDMQRLRDIDSRLQAIMPPTEYASIASTPRSVQSRQSMLFTRTAVETEVEKIGIAEVALKETKEERDFQKRLREIEDELNTLTSAVEHEMESPRLAENQLQSLLDQCALTMQRATDETNALAQSQQDDMSSSRAALLANPPHLEEDVLHKLLEEARNEIHVSSSRLSINENQEGQVEPLTEDNIRELLHDSRATSRNMSRNSAATEDQFSWPLPRKPNWTHRNRNQALEGSESGEQQSAQPTYNGYSPHMNGYSSRMVADNLHLASLDEEEMRSVMVSNGMTVENGERRPFLPDIDPKGSLTTQRQSTNPYNMGDGGRGDTSSRRSSGVLIHNSMSDHSVLVSRDSEGTPTPHPPNSGRPTSGSAGRHRSIVTPTAVD